MLKTYLTKTMYFVLVAIAILTSTLSCTKEESSSVSYSGTFTPLPGFTGSGQITGILSDHDLDLTIQYAGIPIVRAYLIENKNGAIRIQNFGDNPISPFNKKITIADSVITSLNSGNIGVELLTTGGGIALRAYLSK